MDRTFKVCTDCTALPHLSFSIPSVTLRTPFLPPPSPSPHHPFIILLFYYFFYLNTKNSITRVPEMEENKNTHPPPKTRRAQVANACMKCRDAKLKVSIHSFFFFSFFFTNINMKHKHKQYNTKQKEERKKQEINVAHVMKIFHVLYSAPPLVPFAIGVSIGSSRACTT